jgi:hypothetical protein
LYDEEGQEGLPKTEEILGDLYGKDENQWPANESNQAPWLRETKAHQDLIFHFTKCLVSASSFKNNSEKVLLAKYVFPALEAFLVITYVNSYQKWVLDLDAKTYRNKRQRTTVGQDVVEEANQLSELSESSSQKKYTGEARGKGKHKGWTDEGQNLYIKMWKIIKMQREVEPDGELSKGFEEEVRKRFAEQNNNVVRMVREAKIAPDDSDMFL